MENWLTFKGATDKRTKPGRRHFLPRVTALTVASIISWAREESFDEQIEYYVIEE